MIELPTKGEKRAAWNAYGKIAGVESQQYDGRHTWATEIDDLQLVRDASLSYWMGHKIKADESITKKVYIHRLEARLEADKKKLQAYMAEKYKDFTSSIPQISGSQMVVKTEK